jgi:hypothetical protein
MRVDYSVQRIRSAHPLDKNDVLDTVRSFVGICEHLYVGGVSRKWRDRYLILLSRSKPMQPTRGSFYTAYGSVLNSAARFRWAINNKLRLASLLHKPRQMFFAHTVATQSLDPTAVMRVARVHGLQWFGLLI